MRNDYDSITERINEAIRILIGNSCEPNKNFDDSITIVKDEWMRAIIRLQRTADWTKGLAEAHRLYYKKDEESMKGN